MERQARESGICPVREELFSQCFDEIIRQVTLNLPERGLLLLRVRDEIMMTIAAYQTLYQSSVTFAMRKQLQAEHGKADLEKRISELEAKKKKQSNKVIELKSKIEAIQSRNASRREVESKKRQEEIKFLNYQATHLQRFLKQIEQKWAENLLNSLTFAVTRLAALQTESLNNNNNIGYKIHQHLKATEQCSIP